MGLGPIPWTAIDAYAARYGIGEPDQFERFVLLIKAQDSEYLRLQAQKAENGVIQEVSAEDGAGVMQILRNLSAKHTQPASPEPSPPED